MRESYDVRLLYMYRCMLHALPCTEKDQPLQRSHARCEGMIDYDCFFVSSATISFSTFAANATTVFMKIALAK